MEYLLSRASPPATLLLTNSWRWITETENPPNCTSKKCRSMLWNKGGVDVRTREARIKVGHSRRGRYRLIAASTPQISGITTPRRAMSGRNVAARRIASVGLVMTGSGRSREAPRVTSEHFYASSSSLSFRCTSRRSCPRPAWTSLTNSQRSSKRRRNKISRVSKLSLMSGNRRPASSRISLFVNAILPVPTNA